MNNPEITVEEHRIYTRDDIRSKWKLRFTMETEEQAREQMRVLLHNHGRELCCWIRHQETLTLTVMHGPEDSPRGVEQDVSGN